MREEVRNVRNCQTYKPDTITLLISQSLQAILASSLKRAVRDNDVVYVQAVPPPTQLPKIVPAAMVKPAVIREMQDSMDWLLKEGGGALFSGLVPYGVHLALSEFEID